MTDQSVKKPFKILVTGGGTGGHVTPALSVVNTLRSMQDKLGCDPVFLYVGSKHGVEKDLAAEAGISFAGVQTGKLRRARRWYGLINAKNIVDLGRVPVGIGQAFKEVMRFKPDVVLATGGYVAVPPVIAAGILGVPVLIHEQTVQIGLANRIASRFASKIALTFEGSVNQLPTSERKKAIVTGNPVREILFSGDRDRAVERFGFSKDGSILPVIYVTGGAQGARIINRAVEQELGSLLEVACVIHQCGRQPEGSEQDFDRLTNAVKQLPEKLKRRYFVTQFIREEIGDIYAITNLIVGRSGAGTVAEVCALGKPAIFIPLVPTGGDEQTKNAKRVVDAGGGVIIPQAELTGERLLKEITLLISNPEHLETMGKSSLTLATPNASKDIAEALLSIANQTLQK